MPKIIANKPSRIITGKMAVACFTCEQAIQNICSFPYSYPDCTYYLIGDENIRHAIIENYVLIYEVKDEEKQINILRFRYTRMNLTKLVIKDENK